MELLTDGLKIYLDQVEINSKSFTQAALLSNGQLKVTWLDYLGPVIDQGDCSNCWAVAYVEVMNGLINKYMTSEDKVHFADSTGKVLLSVPMLTECSSQQFYKTLDPQL